MPGSTTGVLELRLFAGEGVGTAAKSLIFGSISPPSIQKQNGLIYLQFYNKSLLTIDWTAIRRRKAFNGSRVIHF